MKLISKLLKKQDAEYDDTMGYLTKEDMEKLRTATKRPPSPYRKSTYKKWLCKECAGSFFYAVKKCPSCESQKIEEVTQQANIGI